MDNKGKFYNELEVAKEIKKALYKAYAKKMKKSKEKKDTTQEIVRDILDPNYVAEVSPSKIPSAKTSILYKGKKWDKIKEGAKKGAKKAGTIAADSVKTVATIMSPMGLPTPDAIVPSYMKDKKDKKLKKFLNKKKVKKSENIEEINLSKGEQVMSKKENVYNAHEIAVAILDSVRAMYKNSNLSKAVNTAHEIESGSEPSTVGAECPDYLAEPISAEQKDFKSNDSKKKKKIGENGEEIEESEIDEEISDEDESEEADVDIELKDKKIEIEDESEEEEEEEEPKYQEREESEESEESEEEEEEADKDNEEIIDNASKDPIKDEEKKKKKAFGKSEKLKGFLAKREEKINSLKKEEKGVNRPYLEGRGQKGCKEGVSEAGFRARLGSKLNATRTDDGVILPDSDRKKKFKQKAIESAKNKHKQVIAEQSKMPKPKLGKAKEDDFQRIKGVHVPSTSRPKGVSDVGAMVRNPNRRTYGNTKITAAKDHHKRTLSDIKSMPKPKLGKALTASESAKGNKQVESLLGIKKGKSNV